VERYRNTQTGYAIIYSTVAAAVLASVAAVTARAPLQFWIVPAVVGIMLALFSTMTVRVTEAVIEIKFGIGLIHKSIALSEILTAVPSTTRIWYGWGIHFIVPDTWVYNISGLQAVELRMRNGRRILLGHNYPQDLCAVLWNCGIERGVSKNSPR
jgi:hypothetical protein